VFDALGPLSKQARLAALLDENAEVPLSDIATKSFWSGATKNPLVPESPPKRLRGLWIGTGIALGLTSVAVFWWLAAGSVSISPPNAKSVAPAAGSQKRPSEPVYEDLLPRDLDLMRWYHLLNREPKKIIWPADALSSINFDPARSQLNASCAELGLLSLGRVDVSSYRLRMDLHQNRWSGDVGLILGLRPDSEAPGGYRAQGLLFRMMDVPGYARRLSLRRTQMLFTPHPDGDVKGHATQIVRFHCDLTSRIVRDDRTGGSPDRDVAYSVDWRRCGRPVYSRSESGFHTGGLFG
jgi:hypothetical protein